jgi:hypothetical protein
LLPALRISTSTAASPGMAWMSLTLLLLLAALDMSSVSSAALTSVSCPNTATGGELAGSPASRNSTLNFPGLTLR